MNIINEVISILENEGYSTHLKSENKLIFEDESLCGFVSAHSTTQEIITNWEEIQNNFVKDQTKQLRSDMSKAFNIYSIFLTTDGVREFKSKLNTIQEDFRTSRKIIGCGLNTIQDIRRVFLPITSIQKKSKLEAIDYLNKIRSILINKEIISDKSIVEIFNKII